MPDNTPQKMIDAEKRKLQKQALEAKSEAPPELKEGEEIFKDKDGDTWIKKKLPGGVTSIRQPMHPSWYKEPLPQPKEQKKKAPEPEPAMGRPGRRF